MNASRCGAFACKWLFLRDCGHLTNVRDRGNAKHLRGALIPENPESARTLPGIFLIEFLISIFIIFISFFSTTIGFNFLLLRMIRQLIMRGFNRIKRKTYPMKLFGR